MDKSTGRRVGICGIIIRWIIYILFGVVLYTFWHAVWFYWIYYLLEIDVNMNKLDKMGATDATLRYWMGHTMHLGNDFQTHLIVSLRFLRDIFWAFVQGGAAGGVAFHDGFTREHGGYVGYTIVYLNAAMMFTLPTALEGYPGGVVDFLCNHQVREREREKSDVPSSQCARYT